MPMVKCELEAADSGFDAVLTVLDFFDQGSSHRPCNSGAEPKTSHFITECYVRENATAKEPPLGSILVHLHICVPQAQKNDSVELAKLMGKTQLLLLFELTIEMR